MSVVARTGSAGLTGRQKAAVFLITIGSARAAEVLKFRPLFEQGYDLVVASRIAAGASNEEDGRLLKPRKWFVLALGLIASLLWRRRGATVWDVLHGFRGMRRAAFFALPPLESGLSIDLEMVVRAYRKRLGAIEFAAEVHHLLPMELLREDHRERRGPRGPEQVRDPVDRLLESRRPERPVGVDSHVHLRVDHEERRSPAREISHPLPPIRGAP